VKEETGKGYTIISVERLMDLIAKIPCEVCGEKVTILGETGVSDCTIKYMCANNHVGVYCSTIRNPKNKREKIELQQHVLGGILSGIFLFSLLSFSLFPLLFFLSLLFSLN
jgi:hypothetical protein